MLSPQLELQPQAARHLYRLAHPHLPALFLLPTLCAVVAKGFGSSDVYVLAVALSIGLLVKESCRRGDKVPFRPLLGGVIALLFWPVTQLHGFWVFLVQPGHRRFPSRWLSGAAGAFLVLWLVQETTLGSWTAFPWFGISTFLASAAALSMVSGIAIRVLSSVCLLLSCIQVATLGPGSPTLAIATGPPSPPGYSVGPVLSRVLDARSCDKSGEAAEVGIVSLLNVQEAPFRSTREIFLGEHHLSRVEGHPFFENGASQQREPWSQNQFYGNQYLLAAISRDGFWASNLGGQLKPRGQLLLASARHGTNRTEPLVIRLGSRTYLNDSDPFVDRLAAYQPNVLREIVTGDSTLRLLNALFALCVLVRWHRWLSFAPAFLMLALLGLPKPGDVRYVGEVDCPHEPSKGSGVLRSLADAGFSFEAGNTSTKLLVVQAGRKAAPLETESVVLAEPGARIQVAEMEVTVDTTPLGEVDGIVDARGLIVDGKLGSPVLTMGRHKIIGTGCPAKQEWKRWVTSSRSP